MLRNSPHLERVQFLLSQTEFKKSRTVRFRPSWSCCGGTVPVIPRCFLPCATNTAGKPMGRVAVITILTSMLNTDKF